MHGLRSKADREDQLPPEFANLRKELEEFTSGCIADEGGQIAEIPVRRLAQLEYRARLHRRILQVDQALELRGLIDSHGKLRAEWLAKFTGLINTARNIDMLLGLDRKQRDITNLSPAEWAAAVPQEHSDE